MKGILYVIFFDNKATVMQFLVPKGNTVSCRFFQNVVSKNKSMKYSGLLHDNASADNKHNKKGYLLAEKVTFLLHLMFSQDLVPMCDFFLPQA